MNIIITGGNGYLAGRVGKYLSDNSHYITFTTRPNHKNILQKNKNIRYIEVDYEDNKLLAKYFKNIDIIIHTAGMNAYECYSYPQRALIANSILTSNLVNQAIEAGISRFIYFSTTHVYSKNLRGTITEDNSTDNPHPYAFSKRISEDYVKYAHQNKLIDGIVLRISNGYGSPINVSTNCWMLLVNDLCRQSTEGKINLKTTGAQKRDFIPITSLCNVISEIINFEPGSLHDGVFNVSSNKSMSVYEMAELICKRVYFKTNKHIKIKKGKLNDPGREYEISNNKIKRLGININIHHDSEIDDLINFCLNNLDK